MRSRMGGAGIGFVAGLLLLIAAMGVLWWRDRAREWEQPNWESAGFMAVAGHPEPAGTGERWLVTVNPECPHCREHLARAVAARRRARGVRLGILFVDTPKPPAAAAYANREVDGMWWDVRETWRRRWGHRVYGEVLVFDAGGRYLRTMPPGSDFGSDPAGS